MLISLRGITKVYRVGVEVVHALRGVDLDIGENELVAIMGSSGSGKSTLMNVLGCLDRPTDGTYLLDDRRTDRMTPVELAQVRNERIGFVFQAFELLPRATALANVELPSIYARGERRQNRRTRAKAALERVGLGDRMDHRPNQLSGGQKQRVAIARALLNEPAILLADEPTGNLDSSTTAEILRLFRALHREGQTVVIVTHEDEVAAHCERVVRLHDGRIASDLPIAEDPAGRLLEHVAAAGGLD
jgi:putative ABC transport system ATP-binding protein